MTTVQNVANQTGSAREVLLHSAQNLPRAAHLHTKLLSSHTNINRNFNHIQKLQLHVVSSNGNGFFHSGFGRKKSKTSKKISSVNDKTICMHLHAGRDSSIGMVSSLDLAVDSDESVPLVKMCGITTVHDAVLAAKAGAKFIGMILWPKSKRSVSLNVAKEISKAAREHGAEPVGVFVEEDAKEIEQACDATNIAFVQLHGDRARSALSNLVQHRHIIYVLHADKDGELLTKPPNGEYSDLVDWLLIDSLQGGSGKKFDWEKFRVPTDASKYGWLLAGGVDPENVSQAISILRPDAVDVSSGICAPDGIRKDPARVASFMNAVRRKKWKEF
uniref:phosphoribosylanthranilate isomerase n=1 Tax=Picea sitchensis TaxID=3332 RepID=A9P2D5_PICSI|nr:unknown [Picea sitchensis]